MRKVKGALAALFISAACMAQDADKSTGGHFADSLWSIYQKSRGENLAVYQGRQILGGYPGISGSAYYPFQEWVMGSVQYEGIWYHNLELLFDIYREELMVRHPSGIPFVLYSDRVQFFYLRDRHFVHFTADQKDLAPGFYEIVSEGKLTLYARRAVTLEEKIEDQTIQRDFIAKHRYYALTNGEYKQIVRQKHLMELVKSQRNAINQAVRASGMKFKTQPDAILKLIAETYNKSNP